MNEQGTETPHLVMDGMVEENGTSGSVDTLVSQGTGSPIVVTSVCTQFLCLKKQPP